MQSNLQHPVHNQNVGHEDIFAAKYVTQLLGTWLVTRTMCTNKEQKKITAWGADANYTHIKS